MFSLIITIISIALVAVLALSTLYYGGDAFNRGSAKAEAARLVNEGQQVSGALTLHEVQTGAAAPDIQTLIDGNYLKSAPQGWVAMDGLAGKPVENVDACLEANKTQGVTVVPTWAEYQANPAYQGKALCLAYEG